MNRFLSLTGGDVTVVFTDDLMPVATATGPAFKPRSRGRVTITPEGTTVNREQAALLKEHPFYGQMFTSAEDLAALREAAAASLQADGQAAANAQASREAELQAQIAELQRRLADVSSDRAEPSEPPKPAQPTSNDFPDDDDFPQPEADDEADASRIEGMKEVRNVKTRNGAISYALRFLNATPAGIEAAGGPVEFARAHGVVFPLLEG